MEYLRCKCTQENGGGGICAETGYPLKLPSLTNLARLGHFPPASQAGHLAGPVFYVYVFSLGSSMGNDLTTSQWGYFVCVRNLMKDLANMSGLSLAHWVTTHLSTLFYTVMPLLTTVNHYLLQNSTVQVHQWSIKVGNVKHSEVKRFLAKVRHYARVHRGTAPKYAFEVFILFDAIFSWSPFL